jgi:hypothetical protein
VSLIPAAHLLIVLKVAGATTMASGAGSIPGRASAVPATRPCPAALCAGLPLHADGSALAATPLVCQRAG